MTFAEASTLATGWFDRRSRHRQRVLINGAGGGAGSLAVQLAKLSGAHVTGVDNAGKLDFL